MPISPEGASADPADSQGVLHEGATVDTAQDFEVEPSTGELATSHPMSAATLLSSLTGYVTEISEEDARACLPDFLQNVEFFYESDRGPLTPSERQTRNISYESAAMPTSAASGAVDDGHACGFTHAEPNYQLGCTYASHMAEALTAARDGDHDRAQHQVSVADRALWPLADVNNPDSLRDFIAAAHTGFEFHLRILGTRVPT